MPLLSLPFDVLLAILRDLDIVDVVRTGVTCKDLCGVMQDRHVWIDQLEKLRRNEPAFRTAIPPLASLSVKELKAFVIGWDKLRLHWNRDDGVNGLVAEGLVELSAVEDVWLLPGGKFLLVVDKSKLKLCQIKLYNGRFSLPVTSKLRFGRVGPRWSELLTAMSPYPILIHLSGNTMHLVRVDHHNGTMSLEATFPTPEGYGFAGAHGQGRVIGLLIGKSRGSLRAIVLHLDHPGVSMEFELPPTYSANSGYFQWNIYIPTQSQVIMYDTEHIIAYEVPNFSSVPSGVNRLGLEPKWGWPGPDRLNWDIWMDLSYKTGEASYDPLSGQEFNLHYVCGPKFSRSELFVITVTIPIDTGDNFARKSIELPPLEEKSTSIQYHKDSGWISSRKGLHFDIVVGDDLKLDILVTPLTDLGSEGGGKTLRMLVSFEELKDSLGTIEMDMDEATGRVVIWRWDPLERESKIFIGDLV